MKIGIVGNYGHNNNGDEAILMGILNQIKDMDENCDITVFSDNPEDTAQRHGLKVKSLKYKRGNVLSSIMATVPKVYKSLKEIDVLIIGGGQLLMDLYKSVPMIYCMYAVLGRLAGAKVIYYCVGAGPIDTSIGKFFIGVGLKNSDFISVREKESKDILEEKYSIGDKVVLSSDPAFYLNNSKDSTGSTQKNRTIGFTTLPYYNKVYWPEEDMEKYHRYITVLQEIIEMILAQTNYRIVLFSMVHPADTQSSTDLFDRISDHDRVVNNTQNLKPYELLDQINQCDLVVGTRLHSLILSVVCEKPIIGINYQPKVRNFMRSVGMDDQCFDMDTMNAKAIFDRITSIIEETYESSQSKSAQALKTMRERSKESMQYLEDTIANRA